MLARHHPHPLLEAVELAQQHRMHRKQRLRDRLKVGLPRHQFPDPSGKAPCRRPTDLEPEAAQNPAQVVLDVAKLRLHQLARGQHSP